MSSPEANDAHARTAKSSKAVFIFPPVWFLSYIIGSANEVLEHIYIQSPPKIVSETAGVKEVILGVIVKSPKTARVTQAGSRGLSEAILAGPASGCNRFTVRKIILAAEGRTARASYGSGIVYFLHSGKIALSHGNGELDHLAPGDAAVMHPDEFHHLLNIDSARSVIIAVVAQ